MTSFNDSVDKIESEGMDRPEAEELAAKIIELHHYSMRLEDDFEEVTISDEDDPRFMVPTSKSQIDAIEREALKRLRSAGEQDANIMLGWCLAARATVRLSG